MKTAEELYQYCEDNKLTDGQSRKWGLKHFGVVAAQLEPDEDVRMAFVGLHNQDGMKNDGNFAYAVTNKRILLGQKKLTGQDLATVMLPQITDVSTSTGMLLGTVTIHFVGGIINIGMSKPTAQAVSDKLHALLELGEYDLPTFRERMPVVKDKIAALEAREEELLAVMDAEARRDPAAQAEKIAAVLAAYDDSDAAHRNALLHSVVDRVTYWKEKKTKPTDFRLDVEIKPN